MEKILEILKKWITSKAIGFYFSLASLLLLIIELIAYPGVPVDIMNKNAIIVLIVGIVLFILLSIFRFTSNIAPISLLVCGFLSLIFIAQAEGFIDYFSTQFFEGVSLEVILKLPVPVLVTVLSIILSFIISSVSIYLPQVKKEN